MTKQVSVAMTAVSEQALLRRLVRDDGQEDLCLATYRPSTGKHRTSALITGIIPPQDGDRHIHRNATVTGDYVLRGATIAQQQDSGLVLLHSHPRARGWQSMSGPDREAEASYANLARELTGLPLVGMTLAADDTTWSARHWNTGIGRNVDCTHATNVRVVGAQLAVSWNNKLRPPPQPTRQQVRTISAWGDRCQADLAPRRVLVVGAGSVGLDVIVRLAASGLNHITVMDYDIVEPHNLDRLIGARPRDPHLQRTKTYVAHREATAAATANSPTIEVSNLSICEPEGQLVALDHDLIFSCVDRPWPRAVLNSLPYTDLIPVIDGGLVIDTHKDGTMLNATWRTHVIRPGRPCMICNHQLDISQVIPDKQGLLDDPEYIAGSDRLEILPAQNVAPLSASVSAGLLAQYVSLSVAPSGLGDPGPLQYSLNSHFLDHRDDQTKKHCQVEPNEAVGDQRLDLTDRHLRAEQQRRKSSAPRIRTRILRGIDNLAHSITTWLDSKDNC